MKLRRPEYYVNFQCIAGSCPDSCCAEWDVLVDGETAARYEAMEGPLGDAIRENLKTDEDGQAYFAIRDRRCPMWREDGLCRIQAELNHDALCETCRRFPRLRHDYGEFVEEGLALSCPVAAELILRGDHTFVETEVPGGEEGDYGAQDMACLLGTRDVMLTILSDPAHSVREALALGLLYGYHAQNLFDGGENAPFIPEAELKFGEDFAKKADISMLVDFYRGLEILTQDWAERLKNPQGGEAWPEELRKLAIYGVQRYWLQAISDFDLVGRVKMIVAGCILVRHLGGNILETAQKYAKEVENSQENVDAILDGAYTSPALTDEKLLGWLLG